MSQPSPVTAETFDSQKEIKKHFKILVAVVLLTIINVGLSYAPIPSALRITLIMLCATVSAGLIAAFFMHLLSESQLLVCTIVSGMSLVTAVLFLPLLESFNVPEGTMHHKVTFVEIHHGASHMPEAVASVEETNEKH